MWKNMGCVLLLVVLVACTDKAKPAHKRCLEAEQAGKLAEAVAACETAVAADAESQSGKAAAAKLTDLKPKHDALKAEEEAKEAARKKAEHERVLKEKKAEEERRKEEAACKKWVTFCEGSGGLLDADSKPDCESEAREFMDGFKIKCALPCKCASDVEGATHLVE